MINFSLRKLGFNEIRGNQCRNSSLSSRDVLMIITTGSGKRLTFHITPLGLNFFQRGEQFASLFLLWFRQWKISVKSSQEGSWSCSFWLFIWTNQKFFAQILLSNGARWKAEGVGQARHNPLAVDRASFQANAKTEGFLFATSVTVTREGLLFAYCLEWLDDVEFLALNLLNTSKNLDIPYDSYDQFDFEDTIDEAECIAQCDTSICY